MKISRLISLSTSQLAKSITMVFTGNILAAVLGFLAVLIVSKHLTVNDFGLFNITISSMVIGSHLSNLGMNSSMIRFSSSYLSKGKTAEAAQVLRVTFRVRIVVSFMLAVIIYSTAEILSTKVFHNSSLTTLLKLAAFGVMAISTLNYIKNALYAYQLFRSSLILQLLVDSCKLISVIVIIFSMKMDAFVAVMAWAFAPLIAVLLGLRQLYRKHYSEKIILKNIFYQLSSYGKWLFLSNICVITIPCVGIFMLTSLLSGESAGIYALAMRLTYIVPIINTSLQSVLLPEVSRFKEVAQLEKYIKASLKISFCIGIIIIPFLFFSHKIILFFFGSRYLDSITIFNWLLLGYIVSTINNTLRVALHSIKRPHILAVIDLIKLILMIVGCYFLIPFFGVFAPAVLLLILNISVCAFLILYIFKQIRKNIFAFEEEDIIESYSK